MWLPTSGQSRPRSSFDLREAVSFLSELFQDYFYSGSSTEQANLSLRCLHFPPPRRKDKWRLFNRLLYYHLCKLTHSLQALGTSQVSLLSITARIEALETIINGMLSTELQHLLEGNFHRTVMALGGYKRAGKMIGMSGKYFQEHYLVQ